MNLMQTGNSETPATPAAAAQGQPSLAPGKRHPLLTVVLFGAVIFLVSYSVYLSQNRIYQVDECQNFYMAKVLAAGQSSQFFTSSALFLFGPLSWLTQMHLGSWEMYAIGRLTFLAVFWANILLLASIARSRVADGGFLIALLGAATLAPLWDYGFEIRHDNLVLLGVLVTWWLVRVKQLGIASYLIAGAITVSLLFVAVKSVVYVVPLSGAILLFPPSGQKKSRWILGAAWAGGAILAFLLIRLCYASEGAWDSYLATFRGISKYSAVTAAAGKVNTTGRFAPWGTLERLLTQTPLLLAFTAAACIAVGFDLIRRRRAALTWNGPLPEFLLVLGCFAGLMVNPTPFAYNLVHVVPYAFALAYPFGAQIWERLRDQAGLAPVVAAVAIFLHFFPFGTASIRHLDVPNSRQKELMNLAEDLTDPKNDQVYDATGMVLTRWSIHYYWYLHSLNASLITKPGFRVRDMLSARPATVFIPSYRTDWLQPEDHAFIRDRYIPLADDFWVLGSALPAGGGSFEIFHSGRYCVVPAASLADGTATNSPPVANEPVVGSIDGVALSNKPIELTAGAHRLETSGKSELIVVWVGPNLDGVPSLAPGRHQFLFVNWY